MAVNHPGRMQGLRDLQRTVKQIVTQAMQNASFGSAGLRVYDGGWINIENGGLRVIGSAIVEGTLNGTGTLDWTGPWLLKGKGSISGDTDITGKLVVIGPWDLRGDGKITGNLDGSGRMIWTGPWDLRGAGQIRGNVDITGALDVKNRITLGPSGYLEAGTVRIDRGGSYGGRIASTGSVLALSAGGSVVVDNATFVAGQTSLGATTCLSLDVIGAVSANVKNFRVPHPSKQDHYLLHGSTESPVSGVEYWGEATLPESGELQVSLPDYFEALVKVENRALMVTPRGFIADWGDIENGSFTVTGKPGGRFSWLAKAERKNAEFLTEEPVFGPLRE